MNSARKSKKRDAILDCIRQTKSHPTAEWVYQQLKPVYPDLSLGTVYRNMAMFREEGVIQSIGVVDGLERYDFNTAPHTHFICTGCGQVSDLEQIVLPDDILTQMEGLDYQIFQYQLQFTGICSQCRQKSRIFQENTKQN